MEKKTINTLEDLGVSDVNEVDWFWISVNQKLSENFIERFTDKVDWEEISIFQKLSEAFIERFADNVHWEAVSTYQGLSEDFIERHSDKVYWYCISKHQKLSEPFIEKFSDKVDWICISVNQKLSESFIEKYANKVSWRCISKRQKLSEAFIERFADRVNWSYISKYQRLSEKFVKKFSDNLCLYYIKDNWAYKPTELKKQAVIDTKMYECFDDYFIAYKGIRSDRYSSFNFQYQYLPGETYETHADYSSNECSFGFSAWDYDGAKKHCPELVVKVKIYYKDVARVLTKGNIRCSKMTILD